MNALANSQLDELGKFLGDYGATPPASFGRHTGQEEDQERQRLAANPPDIDGLNGEFLNWLNFGGFPEAVTSPAVRANAGRDSRARRSSTRCCSTTCPVPAASRTPRSSTASSTCWPSTPATKRAWRRFPDRPTSAGNGSPDTSNVWKHPS
ncbi:hypothetical protein [Accumulibacter sp.]|uniref:hypothetical protein n=1 Tax=Accumulibacter sp. TaxID=2053492 RepID=UPI0025FEF00B|nr:hypothetical protein [Accumulibacter sp.]MCM8624488.1 hypothetical protein [Accumulibacter sp.]